jgi:hypothetical protein
MLSTHPQQESFWKRTRIRNVRKVMGNDVSNGRGEEGRDEEDRAELGVRDLRENCDVTLPLNTRCASQHRG